MSPELQAWLDSQRKAGFSDPALREAMLQAGYHPEQADAALGHNAASLPSQAQVQVQVPGATVRLLMQAVRPRMAVFQGILSDLECDQLIALAKPRLDSSRTVDRLSGDSVLHAARVSSGMFFARQENPLVAALEARLSALLGFPEDHGEGLQILHYLPGGKYDPHQDYFDSAEAGSQTHLARGGQRVATVIVYLNTPKSGGGTAFPDVGITVSAVKGNALFFAYPNARPSDACLHGGNPVIEGEKWIATKWVRQGRFA